MTIFVALAVAAIVVVSILGAEVRGRLSVKQPTELVALKDQMIAAMQRQVDALESIAASRQQSIDAQDRTIDAQRQSIDLLKQELGISDPPVEPGPP